MFSPSDGWFALPAIRLQRWRGACTYRVLIGYFRFDFTPDRKKQIGGFFAIPCGHYVLSTSIMLKTRPRLPVLSFLSRKQTASMVPSA
jgi:hypothetical protein